MAQTMAMGQAAGLAAVISLSSDYPACELPVNLLRESLMEHGAILEPPSRVADTSRNGWTNNVN
jgi:hypothetical protein